MVAYGRLRSLEIGLSTWPVISALLDAVKRRGAEHSAEALNE